MEQLQVHLVQDRGPLPGTEGRRVLAGRGRVLDDVGWWLLPSLHRRILLRACRARTLARVVRLDHAREILGLDGEVDLGTRLTGDSPFKVVGQESLTANGSKGSERHAHNL